MTMVDEQGEVQQGGSSDVMPMQRLEDVEKRLENLADEFVRQAGESVAATRRIEALEAAYERHEQSIQQMKESTQKMELIFNRITQQLDNQDMKLFQLLQQGQKEGASERTAMAKERTAILKEFLKFSTYIIGGTVIFILGQLFLAP